MGIGPTFGNLAEQHERVLAYFEQQLIPLKLSEEQISTQSLDELNDSLERLNDAIKNPDSFGELRLVATVDGGLVIAKAHSEYHQKIGILPLLLKRKQQIIDRIRVLSQGEKVDSLRAAVDRVSDEDVRKTLVAQLDELEAEAKKLRQESEKVEKERQQQSIPDDIAIATQRVELLERRSKVWRSFLERESMATVVGALLLIVFTLSLLVAMFTQLEPSQVVTSAFLLILGYFFGQSVNRKTRDE